MGKGVFTLDERVTFVNGWMTGGTDPADGSVECGDGAPFPMELTLSQLAELLFRVKDAWITEGYVTITVSGSPGNITASTTAPTNRATQIDSQTHLYRGYTKTGADSYNNAEYDAGYGVNYSDIADDENGIWRNHWSSPDFIDAFHYAADDPNSTQVADSNWFNAYGTVGVKAGVIRGNRVGIVKLDPAHGFYAATNRFFLELEFYFFDYDEVLTFGGSTRIDGGQVFGVDPDLSYIENVCNYIIRLSGGDISCPFYMATLGADSVTGVDFVHQPQEWWPYAKGVPAVPVWDADTGLEV